MVDFASFWTLFLLPGSVIFLFAIRRALRVMLVGRGGIRRAGIIGVGRIDWKARHGTKSGVLGVSSHFQAPVTAGGYASSHLGFGIPALPGSPSPS